MGNKLIAHALIQISAKYLIIKRSKYTMGQANVFGEYWDILGGMIEVNELPQIATIREVKEETNLDVKINRILYEESNLDKEKQIIFTRLVYECEQINSLADQVILNPEEHSEYKLISFLNEISAKKKIVPYLEKIIPSLSQEEG